MEAFEFIVVIICGFGIGTLSGMFGIGGGGMIVPLLYIAFNVPIVAATSTSLFTIAPTGISGSIKHFRQKTVSLKTGALIGGFGAIASVGGSLAAGHLHPYFTIILTSTVILFSVGMMLRTLLKDKTLGRKEVAASSATLSDELELTARITAAAENATAETIVAKADTIAAKTDKTAAPKKDSLPLLYPLVIGLIAGVIAGIVGVGGGFIIVPFCVAYLGFSLKKAAGTSLVAISLIAIPGIISHALLGHIEWFYGFAIILGTIPGAQLGSWLIARLPERPMRFAFAGLLTLIGLSMIAQEFLL
ncbi:MAG: sulfite exporter TauE/SafE family protein [Coriobacteriia bacterium]|nr:sulfite exporter TauE/SafE family protein [Coriobacteriia bacterium]